MDEFCKCGCNNVLALASTAGDDGFLPGHELIYYKSKADQLESQNREILWALSKLASCSLQTENENSSLRERNRRLEVDLEATLHALEWERSHR